MNFSYQPPVSFRSLITESLATLTLNLIKKNFRKIKDYEKIFKEEIAISEIVHYMKEFKSHLYNVNS